MSYKYLPNQLDADAVNTLIAVIGGGVPLSDTVDAAYHVGGFALAKIVPETHAGRLGQTDKEKVELLVRLRNHYAGQPDLVAAVEIPWALVWMIVQQIINKYLQG